MDTPFLKRGCALETDGHPDRSKGLVIVVIVVVVVVAVAAAAAAMSWCSND